MSQASTSILQSHRCQSFDLRVESVNQSTDGPAAGLCWPKPAVLSLAGSTKAGSEGPARSGCRLLRASHGAREARSGSGLPEGPPASYRRLPQRKKETALEQCSRGLYVTVREGPLLEGEVSCRPQRGWGPVADRPVVREARGRPHQARAERRSWPKAAFTLIFLLTRDLLGSSATFLTVPGAGGRRELPEFQNN